MKWYIVTSDATRHIIPAQEQLFDKYVPGADVIYVDVGNEPVETWTANVLKRLNIQDEYAIFGLDDFLPIDYWDHDHCFSEMNLKFDRMELGWGGSRKGGIVDPHWTLFAPDELYRVSCQFSIWRTEALRDALTPVRSPWKFETKGGLSGDVYGMQKPWRYIEESALSGRQPGRVNLCGLRKEDIHDLIWSGAVDHHDIIYGWKGQTERTEEVYGKKYAEYF